MVNQLSYRIIWEWHWHCVVGRQHVANCNNAIPAIAVGLRVGIRVGDPLLINNSRRQSFWGAFAESLDESAFRQYRLVRIDPAC